jgi:ribosomal protein S18 acetylase RimI-like enzyme
MAKRIIIRQAIKNDLPMLRKMNAEHFLHERTDYDKTLCSQWVADGREEEFLARAIADSDACVFVAQDGDKLVGYIESRIWNGKTPWRTVDTKAEIVNIFMDEKYRGQKIGSRLIKKVLAWARDKKVGAVIVDPYVTNARAIKFYRRNGLKDYTLRLEARFKKS